MQEILCKLKVSHPEGFAPPAQPPLIPEALPHELALSRASSPLVTFSPQSSQLPARRDVPTAAVSGAMHNLSGSDGFN